MSADELQRLRDRIEQLEMILGVDEPLAVQLRLAFNLTGSHQPRILGMLLNRTMVTHDGLWSMLYGNRPDADLPTSDKTIHVHVHKLRKHLRDAFGIEFRTVVDAGYAMDVENKRKVRERLGRVDDPICKAAAF